MSAQVFKPSGLNPLQSLPLTDGLASINANHQWREVQLHNKKLV
jgi:hypothetical protein